MPSKCPDPEWYVYVRNFNGKRIEKYNVFRSFNFDQGCRRIFKRFKDIEKIEDEIKAWAKYSFWSKCEYEIVITSFPEVKDFEEKKIDVFDQLMMNWDSFFQYVVDHKAYFLRRCKYVK